MTGPSRIELPELVKGGIFISSRAFDLECQDDEGKLQLAPPVYCSPCAILGKSSLIWAKSCPILFYCANENRVFAESHFYVMR